MCKSSIASEIAIGLHLFFDWESLLFYQQCNACDAKIFKLIRHCVTAAQVQSKVTAIVADVGDLTPSHLRFLFEISDPIPFQIFLSPLS